MSYKQKQNFSKTIKGLFLILRFWLICKKVERAKTACKAAQELFNARDHYKAPLDGSWV